MKATANEARAERRRRRWIAAAIVLFVVLAIPAAWYVWFLANFGDPGEPEGLHIVNQTDEALTILVVLGDGTEAFRTEVPAQAEIDSHIECQLAPMVARSPDGELVATRESSKECNQTPWVIPER